MSDYSDALESAFELHEHLEIPRLITASGVQFITRGTKYHPFKTKVTCFTDFIGLTEALLHDQDEGDRCLIRVAGHEATAHLRWPIHPGQEITLTRVFTDEARAWLHAIEVVQTPKALAEFIEDYGDWLNAPEGESQPNRLDLASALSNLRISNRTDGSIEYRPHGDRAEFSIARTAKSSTTVELPVTLWATPQTFVGDDSAYRIKVRINYSVDESNEVHVRCRVVNRNNIELQSTEDLVERLRESFSQHDNCIVVF